MIDDHFETDIAKALHIFDTFSCITNKIRLQVTINIRTIFILNVLHEKRENLSLMSLIMEM